MLIPQLTHENRLLKKGLVLNPEERCHYYRNGMMLSFENPEGVKCRPFGDQNTPVIYFLTISALPVPFRRASRLLKLFVRLPWCYFCIRGKKNPNGKRENYF
ncbi:MAG: hypothetical protein ABI707_16080 [Ferruginibacter sp.]